MAPIRRYVRVSRFTVLEMRIHLENPSDAHRWLLRAQDPALPRVMEAIRPLIGPKLNEARDNDRKAGKNKEIVTDLVVRGTPSFIRTVKMEYEKVTERLDDFEVSVYFRPLMTQHSILKRHKVFTTKQKDTPRAGGTHDAPVDLEEEDAEANSRDRPQLLREHSDDAGVVKMEDIPTFDGSTDPTTGASVNSPTAISDTSVDEHRAPPTEQDDEKKKKKLGMTAYYEGFRVDDHVLTLLVTRKDTPATKGNGPGGSHAMMQDWITSTQKADAIAVDD